MKAAENGHLSVVRYLMEHGAASCIDTQNRVRSLLFTRVMSYQI